MDAEVSNAWTCVKKDRCRSRDFLSVPFCIFVPMSHSVGNNVGTWAGLLYSKEDDNQIKLTNRPATFTGRRKEN